MLDRFDPTRSRNRSLLEAAESELERQYSFCQREEATQIREGEDAHLTGTTRSLERRLLGLNVTALGAFPDIDIGL